MLSEPIVGTHSGKIRGVIERSILNVDYYAFKGIPYAKPPIGQLRFQDPVPAESWPDVRDASRFGGICAQMMFLTNNIEGGDDCLYLNVYTKFINSTEKLPVMVWIHGGGFVKGDSGDTMYGPDYFLRKDIVLVTINYRVGVLGFLNLEDDVAPGNQGLKDQVMALKWVRENIKNFGGDPENVTIFGESAGSASVHYLTLSPLAKGLFDKAICQSGVVLNPWTHITVNPKSFAYKLCELLGNKTQDSKKIVEYLRTVDVKKLIETQEKLLTNDDNEKLIFPFAPGIDDKSKNPFMPIHPMKAAEKGVQVPLLIGYTSREGILFMSFVKDLEEKFPILKSNLSKNLHPNFLKLLEKQGIESNDLWNMYFGNDNELTKEKLETFVDFISDMQFVKGIHQVVNIQVEKSSAPTYLYQYSYDKIPSPFKLLLKLNIKGASHADELQHLFRSKLFEPLKKETDAYKIMEQMIELWTNFARTGRPTPTTSELIPFYWQPITNDKVFRCLNIDDNLRMESVLSLEERYSTASLRKSSC